VVTDNARNNTSMMTKLQELWSTNERPFDSKQNHVRCLAHILNVAIQDALGVLGSRPVDSHHEATPKCLKLVKNKNKMNIMMKITMVLNIFLFSL
jgi:hypothetical protein